MSVLNLDKCTIFRKFSGIFIVLCNNSAQCAQGKGTLYKTVTVLIGAADCEKESARDDRASVDGNAAKNGCPRSLNQRASGSGFNLFYR